jgi:ribosomal protein L16/L10AE
VIFFGSITTRQLEANKQAIKKYFTSHTDPARITFVTVPSEVDRTEVWRVPIGASDPRVEEGIVVP